MDVKIGFGPSGKIKKVECEICRKVYIRGKKEINLKVVLIVILLFIILMLFFLVKIKLYWNRIISYFFRFKLIIYFPDIPIKINGEIWN